MWLFSWLVFALCLYMSECHDNRIYPQDVCETDIGVLNCTCANEDNLTVYEITDAGVDAIEVHNCGHVTIESVAFLNLHIQYAVFNNISVLEFKRDAFKNVGSLDFLQLSNIVSLKVIANSIVTVNTSKVLLLNVTCENVKPLSFQLQGVTHSVIVNSSFGTVESAGFRLINPQFVFVMNSTFENLLTGAIQVNGTSFQIYIQETKFVMAQKHSFYFESLQYLTIKNCEFQDLYTGAMFGHVMNFLLTGNTIVNMESSVFTSLNISYFFELTDNKFINSYPGALDYDLNRVPNVTIANNTFTCNCDTVWLMETKYELFQVSSFCDTSIGNIPLTDLDFKDLISLCEKSQVTSTDSPDTSKSSPHESIASKTDNNSQVSSTDSPDSNMPSPHESIASKTDNMILDINTIIISVLFCSLSVFWF